MSSSKEEVVYRKNSQSSLQDETDYFPINHRLLRWTNLFIFIIRRVKSTRYSVHTSRAIDQLDRLCKNNHDSSRFIEYMAYIRNYNKPCIHEPYNVLYALVFTAFKYVMIEIKKRCKLVRNNMQSCNMFAPLKQSKRKVIVINKW